MGVSKLPLLQQRTDEFTTSGTWVCPADVLSAEFLVVGAGGGGGGAYCSLVTNAVGGGGGGGGAVKKVTLPTTPGSTYTITVGAKGTGGTSDAGVSGGYSEVVLSGTTLIRCLGGAGGSGINTTPLIVQVSMVGLAGGGGYVSAASATDTSACTGGGGGASQIVPVPSDTAIYMSDVGSEGGVGRNSSTTPNIDRRIKGGMGIDGFGAGGNGGNWHTSTATTFDPPYGAGAGGVRSAGATGAANGSNATIAGCGGGAGIAILSAATASSGGNGADGLVRITYLA